VRSWLSSLLHHNPMRLCRGPNYHRPETPVDSQFANSAEPAWLPAMPLNTTGWDFRMPP